MLLGVLFTCLSRKNVSDQVNSTFETWGTNLGRLADLLADDLPLVVFVVFNRVEKCLAL